jgi:diguanylate cyclase (GGDEF)-like protein
VTNSALAANPKDEDKQALRLRRLLMGAASYAFTFALVLVCWHQDFLTGKTTAQYLAIVVAINLTFYVLIRSGLNLRFSDPSMTLAQMVAGLCTGFFAMYYARDARGAFVILVMAVCIYGLFKFRTREFGVLTVLTLAGYAGLIALLMHFRPQEVHLQIEVLQWIALAAMLLQLIGLGGYIGGLRHKVKEKNQELAKRNAELENALRRIHDLAIRDELTGVYNRRYLMEIISMEKQRCDRSGHIFSLCIIDVDFFKRVNDVYGHLAGDEVLRTVASAAAATMRQTDFFGRYGGEEFAMVLTGTSVEGALLAADRVRQRIESLSFPKISPDLRVTISIGITEFQRTENADATFQRADEALYRAKEGGRNRCITAGKIAA